MIDPTAITDEVLEELTVICEAATQDEWKLGHTGTETLEAAATWMTETLSKRDSADVWLVFCGDPDGENITPAVTGNGPTSEANAVYLCAVQPINVYRLITEIKRGRNEIMRLTRLLEKQ
jgi:hypothetical protein